MKIAAFDPASLKNIGWATWDTDTQAYETGTFVIPSMEHNWQVLWPMYQKVNKLLINKKPQTVIVEQTSAFRSKKAAFVGGQVSQCMGVIFAACGKNKSEVSLVFPTSVKKIIAGYGKATKTKMEKSVINIMSNLANEKPSFSSEHACDALANILFWLVKKEIIEIEKDWYV